ncbi:DUF4097 family beta strand repeat-containing protein [Brevibacillus ginsengisoli]|uniref:DUF4097 family beta strand repeat-containing protein n=1 Tax=Brevibacillus ginsengisoli TaxID=363854 RepID=UPI003CF6D253
MKKLLGVIIILVGVFLLLKSITNIELGGWVRGEVKHLEGSASVANIDTIHIQIPSANLQIVTEDRSDLLAALQGSDADKFTLQVQRKNNSIDVNVDDPKTNWFNFSDDMKLVVHVPMSYQQKLEVEATSGRVEFTGHSSSSPAIYKELNVNVSSGDIRLDNLQVGQLKIEGTSGSIRSDRVTADKSTLEVSSGDIRMDRYTGAIDASLSSGSLDIQLEKVTGSIHVEASSGDVKLQLPKDADVTVDAKVSSGNVKADFPLENTTIYDENSQIKGSKGAGTYPIDLEANSGSIKIR